MTDLPLKKTQEQRMRRPTRSNTLRRLLPKPPRKDPPDIVHIKVLPQQSPQNEDEDNDKDSLSDNQEGGYSDNGLAEELPSISGDENIKNTAGEGSPVENEEINTENDVVMKSNERGNEEKKTSGETGQETSSKGANVSDKKSANNTPKPPLIKKHISRSTPRRNSHVRALSFNTPHKPMFGRKANTSPKMPKVQFSPRSFKLDHVKRSSLFKSPPSPKMTRLLPRLTEEDEAEESKDHSDEQEFDTNSPLSKIPIATRSPAPKLSTAWKEVNDVTITEKPAKQTENPIKSTNKPAKSIDKSASRIQKPQWDDKIRSFICGDFVDPVPPPKKQYKEKLKEKAPVVLKKAAKPLNNDSSIRRSKRLTKSTENTPFKCDTKTESLLKDPSKCNNKSKRKINPETLENSSTTQPTVMNKQSNKSTNKPVSRRNQKVITPKIVNSSTDDTSSLSCEDFSKSATTNLNRVVISPISGKRLERNISSPDCQTNQSETNSCKEVVNKGSSNDANITSSILLDDLVLSSNSGFPLAVEDSAKEQLVANLTETNKIKIANDSTDQLKPHNSNMKESVSPKFALPLIPVQETPLKDIQAVLPATPVLNTPLMKTIRQETSVLEEDLLLTPSLPPTPQAVSPHYLGLTPSKPVETLEAVADKAQQNCSPQIGNDNKTEVSCTSRTTNVIVSDQKVISDTSSDSVADCPDKMKLAAKENRSSSSTSKYNVTSSSESSDEEIMKCFLNRSVSSPSKLKPTIKTRIIQGPVSTKRKGCINNRKIYTSTDSSDEENNHKNVNNDKNDQPSEESNQSLLDLRTMLLEKERNRIERLSKVDVFVKKQKTRSKKKLPTRNKTIEKNLSGNFRSTLPIEETKLSVQLNKSSLKTKSCSPKHQSKNKNDRKPTLTPEKICEQLENDLSKQERQHIFGDDFSLSSSTESEPEVFEKKKPINEQKKTMRGISKKQFKNQDIFLSDESSNEVVNQTIAIANSSKSVRFETTPKIGIVEECNSVRKSLEAAVNAKAFNKLKNITENSAETENVGRNDEMLCAVYAVNSSELCSNHESNNTLNISHANLQSESCSNKVLSDRRCANTGESQVSVDDNSFGMNQNSNGSNMSYDKSSDLLPPAVSSNSGNTINTGEIKKVDQSDCVSRLTRASTPYYENSLPQYANSSAVADREVPGYVDKIDKSEAHISVVSNDSTRKNTKPVSLNMPEFDPDILVVFETDNGAVTLSYSTTIFHFEMTNKTDHKIFKRNIHQDSFKTECQKPSKGVDGKRRVKLTPVVDGKYEKLKVDYDIIDGKVIRKREERQNISEADVLDCTCSTIDADSTPDPTTINKIVSMSRFDFKGSELSLQNSRKTHENKERWNKTASDFEETKKLSHSFSGKSSQIKQNTTEKEIIPLFVKTSTKVSEHKLSLASTSELSIGPKEAKLKSKHSDEPVMQRNRKPEYEDKRSKYQLDKRKEVELRDRRRERDVPERFIRKDLSRRYLSIREDDRRRYSERRRHRSPERYHRSHLDRSDSRKYYARTPPHQDYDRDTKHSERRRETKRLSKPSTTWKDVDDVKEQENKRHSEEETNAVFDPRAEQKQLTSYSDVEKNSTSDGADSLMDFAVLSKSKRLPNSSQISPVKESVKRIGQQPKRKASVVEDISEVSQLSQANKKLKMEEKDMREAKSVLKHKMADMLNVLHPDTSNEAS